MNGIKFIGSTSFMDFKAVVYAYVVSNITSEGDDLVSKFSVEDIIDTFSEIDDAGKIIRELKRDKFFTIKDGYIYVGTCTDGIKRLYNGQENSLKEDFAKVYAFCDSYIEDCKGIRKSIAIKLKEDIQSIENLPKYAQRDLMKLYVLVHTAYLQDNPREFQDKEYGQMKSLMKIYDTPTCIRLIIAFLLSYDKWCKFPSIGNMLYYKDDIFGSLSSSSRRTKMRSADVETGF